MRIHPFRRLRGTPVAASIDLVVGVFAGLVAATQATGGQPWWCATFALLALWSLYAGADTFWWLHHTGYGRGRRQLIRHTKMIGDGMWMAGDGSRTTWTAARGHRWFVFRFRVIFEAPGLEESVTAALEGERHMLWRVYVIPPMSATIATDMHPVEFTPGEDGKLTATTLLHEATARERHRRARSWGRMERDTGAGTVTAADLDELNGRLATAYRQGKDF